MRIHDELLFRMFVNGSFLFCLNLNLKCFPPHELDIRSRILATLEWVPAAVTRCSCQPSCTRPRHSRAHYHTNVTHGQKQILKRFYALSKWQSHYCCQEELLVSPLTSNIYRMFPEMTNLYLSWLSFTDWRNVLNKVSVFETFRCL